MIERNPNIQPCDYCGDEHAWEELIETDDGYLLCPRCYDDWLEEQAEAENEDGDE